MCLTRHKRSITSTDVNIPFAVPQQKQKTKKKHNKKRESAIEAGTGVVVDGDLTTRRTNERTRSDWSGVRSHSTVAVAGDLA